MQQFIYNHLPVSFSNIWTTNVESVLVLILLSLEMIVRYHCGGCPEEVNACVLNSYMVYL
jgi:hypothetical protein